MADKTCWAFNCKMETITLEYLYTHTFNGPLSGSIRVSRYQKGKTNLDLLKQETVSGSGISWAISTEGKEYLYVPSNVPLMGA